MGGNPFGWGGQGLTLRGKIKNQILKQVKCGGDGEFSKQRGEPVKRNLRKVIPIVEEWAVCQCV